MDNKLVEELVERIAKEPLAAGGSVEDILVTLEGVIVGVMTLCIKPWGDEMVLRSIFDGAGKRLIADRHNRLNNAKPAGEA